MSKIQCRPDEMKKCFYAILLLLLFGCSEQIEEKFSVYEDALKSKSGKGNWLPAMLPRNATDIFIQYYIEEPRIISKFQAKKNFIDKLQQQCTAEKIDLIRLNPLKSKWFPSAEEFRNKQVEVMYKCIDGYYMQSDKFAYYIGKEI